MTLPLTSLPSPPVPTFSHIPCRHSLLQYVPQIIEYVEVIEQKGLAYASQGSVYLDTVRAHAPK